MKEIHMMSDFGNRLLVKWRPYKNIHKLFNIPSELFDEFNAWSIANNAIRNAQRRAREDEKVIELLKFHFPKSK